MSVFRNVVRDAIFALLVLLNLYLLVAIWGRITAPRVPYPQPIVIAAIAIRG